MDEHLFEHNSIQNKKTSIHAVIALCSPRCKPVRVKREQPAVETLSKTEPCSLPRLAVAEVGTWLSLLTELRQRYTLAVRT